MGPEILTEMHSILDVMQGLKIIMINYTKVYKRKNRTLAPRFIFIQDWERVFLKGISVKFGHLF